MLDPPTFVWERLAAPEGGTVAALTAVAIDEASLVFAATPAGVRRSTDGGHTWSLAGTATSVPFAEAIFPSPDFSRDRTLMVGGGEGLYRSTDAGQSWQLVLTGSRVLAVAAADTGDASPVWLAATETDGILRSEDVGKTWTGANAGLIDLTVTAVAMSPSFQRDRLGLAGTPSGLYRTRNAGRAWRAVDTPIQEPAIQCVAFSADFERDRLVLAGTEVDGLLRSEDAGSTWDIVSDLSEHSVTAVAFGRDLIAAATDVGVALSGDGGRTWRPVGAELEGVLCLAFVRSPAEDMLLAGLAGRGVAFASSSNDYRRWTRSSQGLNASLLLSLALTPATLFVAGPQEGVRGSTDGGLTWSPLPAGLDDATVMGLAVSTTADQSLYAATNTGLFRASNLDPRWNRLLDEPMRAVTTADDKVVAAAAGGHLFISSDAGDTWRMLHDEFDGAEVLSLAVAADRTIFVATRGTREVVVWRSTGEGEHWDRWLIERPAVSVAPLAVSPAYETDKRVFLGLAGRVLQPLRGTRETRSGEQRPIWTGAAVGDGLPVTALAISPDFARDRTLFAASGGGVFVSRDAGNVFTRWSDGLDESPVVFLAVSPEYAQNRLVYALGLGGSVWRRPDSA